MHAHGIAVGVALLALSEVGAHAALWPGDHPHRSPGLRMAAEDAPPSEATTPGTEEQKGRGYLGNEPLESCMNRWDPGTHMTKDAWRESCKRITQERGPYVKGR
jgi:hypothetical protein